MNLNLSQIKDITLGTVRVEEDENGIRFYRFTKVQEELYKNRNDGFYMKSFATSGVKIKFRTNSQTLFLKVQVSQGSSRSYFSFDLFVNGERTDFLNNFSDTKLQPNYSQMKFPLGEFSKQFSLGTGEKDVCIYFPWSASVILKELVLDDNSFIEPQSFDKKLLCFGDSITHGYDALYPSNKYATRLADWLGAEEYNKAIGGEIFFPELAAAKEDFEPDYITVAYGTNDWYICSKEEFSQNCKAFFDNLALNYPKARIFAITPIWRKDYKELKEFGRFEEVEQIIKNTVQPYENVKVVSGFNMVNHDESYFGDLALHPNDEGFEQYFKSLAKQIIN